MTEPSASIMIMIINNLVNPGLLHIVFVLLCAILTCDFPVLGITYFCVHSHTREAQVNNVAEDLERYKGTQRSFEAFRLLRKTEYKPFKMVDADGNICNNPSTVIPIINTFYQAFYNQTGMEPTEPFMTDPKALSHPITAAEVEASAKMLRNGRASGSDGLCGELIKYGGEELFKTIADIYNQVFEKNQSLESLLKGILVVLNKPNKPVEVKNTRPITLLNMIRKMLSTIILKRITLPWMVTCPPVNPASDQDGKPPMWYGRTDGSRHVLNATQMSFTLWELICRKHSILLTERFCSVRSRL
jgi:hypothetical protein